ncbi:M56 family metallopeptidase [Lunatibacter salilacus]|uniref:M56 family metallopeptidase n=1 Tax=Lunatibacter salilacus TaxID=2483804 RepID=UPI00131EAC84|nr:M56 family metallopeptidase [Lunatibacter salilacus]
MMVLVKFIACSAFLMLLFHLFLAKEKSFQLNRWILLALIPAAMIIPFLSFPIVVPDQNPVQIEYLPIDLSQSATVSQSNPSPKAFSPIQWFLFVYIPVFFFLLITKLKALNQLIVWTKNAPVQHIPGALLILSEKVLSPFSFGKYIFMHPAIYNERSENTQMILSHERVHINHRHHLDLLWMEFLLVVFWFNPVVYLVKRAMVLNHEYLADHEVQQAAHPIKYKKLLLELTIHNNPGILTSSISSSALKNRLTMMNKPITKNIMQFRIFSFSLISLLIIAGFSVEINAQQNPSTSQKQNQVTDDTFFEVETQPEFKGGMPAFYMYVVNELEYPLRARRNGIEGEVVVQFVVEKDGSLSNVSAINELGGGCEEEAIRVVKNSAAFKPGMQRGRPVRVQMVLPIHFSLDKEKVGQDGHPTGKIIVEGVEQRNGELKVDASYADGFWTGTVRDPEGNTLPGAHIIIVDTTKGTVTDINGDFSIFADASRKLVVSFMGYQSVRLGK